MRADIFLKHFRQNVIANAAYLHHNLSRSCKGILRGLHYQRQKPQGKLVYVVRGAVLDVAVDIRKGSPTFGQVECVELNDENCRQLYVPPGFAHGFCALSEVVDFAYKCTDYYDPADERGVLWNDPDLGIQWPVDNPILAPRDMAFPCLKDIAPNDLPQI